jgi:hypothetical protein
MLSLLGLLKPPCGYYRYRLASVPVVAVIIMVIVPAGIVIITAVPVAPVKVTTPFAAVNIVMHIWPAAPYFKPAGGAPVITAVSAG